MGHLILLGTDGCHLCEQAESIIADALNQYKERITLEHIDIAVEEQWQQDYAIRIPVLISQPGQQEIAWPFTQAEIKKFIDELSYD